MSDQTTHIDGQLQIEHERGVIYFHASEKAAKERNVVCVLRICNLPCPIPQIMERGLDIMHLQNTDWEGEVKLAKGFPRRNLLVSEGLNVHVDPTFGQWIDMRPALPPDCEMLILCYNTGTGLKPYRLLLPHQVRVKDLMELVHKNKDIAEITAIPVRSSEYINIAKVI